MDDRPLILCSNDDGIASKGLKAVADALSAVARVVVVAPETEQSATSHSLTLHRPLRLRRVEDDRFALDGTPADCVYLALHLGEGPSMAGRRAAPMLPRKPDLVVSGVNRGLNLGQDVFYSGTVAAAREGALRGIPSIAASVEVLPDASGAWVFDPQPAAALIASMARAMLATRAIARAPGEPALLLNVNLPAGPVKGVVHTCLGNRLWTETVEGRVDPRGRAYYWIGGEGVSHDQIPGSDTEAFDGGLVSVTALSLDLGRRDDAARRSVLAVIDGVKSA